MLQLPMAEHDAARALLLLLPVAVWIGLFLKGRFTTREHTAALLAFVWQFQASLIVALVFTPNRVLIALLIGQSVTIGAVNSLLLIKRGVLYCIAVSAFLLFVFKPVTGLFSLWYLVSLLFVCVPSLLLASWTAWNSHIYLRATLQTLCWACLLLWFFPNAVFSQLHGGWEILLNRSLVGNAIYLTPLLVPGLILLNATYQFAVEGNGTGFPYDPPDRLVTKGIYAYFSNPMQVGICLLMLFWGVALMNAWICASAAIAVFLFVVFKDICNGSCAIGKTDPNWEAYQCNVPRWLPALKPWSLHK
jgi:protein-S-isoprenylcysteine O-methyltransferase Ste14